MARTPALRASPDLTYRKDGLFVRFYAETEAGVSAWNTMAETLGGTAAILSIHLAGTLAQLRKAGYVVEMDRRKLPSIDDILNELNA